ncbi:MAG: hydroxyethylthiazole kinase [Oscillospiraceae bacterium]
MNNIIKQVSALITEVRNKVPLVHQITNYVTVNDCANITLAIGASPIMADDMAEAADITAISSALVINIGTLNERTVSSMLASGKRANALGIPVVFDPVGAGASKLRNDTTRTILKEVRLSVLRGNLSEVSFVAGLKATTRGVDASEADSINDAVTITKDTAQMLGCTVAVTGAVDVISDGRRTVTIQNGHKMLSNVTGTGCMATALIGAFAGVTDDSLLAAAAGIAAMGIAGEIAFNAAGGKGTGSFRSSIIDAVSLLDENLMEESANINEI